MSKKTIPFGYIDGKDIYLSGYLSFSDRKIGEVKETDEDSIEYFKKRFEAAKDKVAQLEHDIENAENKGSYLMKLIHLRKKLGNHDGLGDYTPLFEKLDSIEAELENLIAENKKRNQEIKDALLQEFNQFGIVQNWKEATENVLDLKERWLKTGAVVKEKNEEYEKLFSEKMTDFFDRKRQYVEEKKQVLSIRLDKMRALIQSVRRFNADDALNLKDEVDKFRSQWDDIGAVPFRDKKFLEKDFNRSISQLFRKKRPFNTSISPEEMQKNLETKRMLLEKAIELEKDDAFMELQELQKEWQKVGMIPKEDFKELTESFKTICEKSFEKRFLEQLAHNKDEDYQSKNNREKTRFKIILLKDLLKRDEKDLQSFMHNMERFGRAQKFDRVMNNKLLNQKRKVNVKKELLNELKNSLNDVPIQK